MEGLLFLHDAPLHDFDDVPKDFAMQRHLDDVAEDRAGPCGAFVQLLVRVAKAEPNRSRLGVRDGGVLLGPNRFLDGLVDQDGSDRGPVVPRALAVLAIVFEEGFLVIDGEFGKSVSGVPAHPALQGLTGPALPGDTGRSSPGVVHGRLPAQGAASLRDRSLRHI